MPPYAPLRSSAAHSTHHREVLYLRGSENGAEHAMESVHISLLCWFYALPYGVWRPSRTCPPRDDRRVGSRPPVRSAGLSTLKVVMICGLGECLTNILLHVDGDRQVNRRLESTCSQCNLFGHA